MTAILKALKSRFLSFELISAFFLQLESAEFVILEVGDTRLILDDEDSFTVTAFDANHCPGKPEFPRGSL